MKVFISWSGPLSQQLGEAIRDWLPGVLQLVNPYFTPSDIQKGTRWSTDVARELSASQVGILCITQDNLHSDWVLFEAGALSKALDKSHVCPILFGITSTDLAGPLKQFQTTEFEKEDFSKLVSVINNKLGENKLPSKTLDTVFEKWWPDLESKVNQILATINEPDEPIRSDRDVLEEILQMARVTVSQNSTREIAPEAVQKLLQVYIELHDDQVAGKGGYQETLDTLKQFDKAIGHIARRYLGVSAEIDELFSHFQSLSYQYVEIQETTANDYDPIPF